jgi:two-component system phosphate regulon response regulator PhoB
MIKEKAIDSSILVVEGQTCPRQMLAANLQNSGYKVRCAGDVAQAEALMREVRPELVLLDWALPGVPGLPFTRRGTENRLPDVSDLRKVAGC